MRNETDICSCHTWILALPRLGGSNCRALEPSDSSEKAVSADALSTWIYHIFRQTIVTNQQLWVIHGVGQWGLYAGTVEPLDTNYAMIF